MSTTLMSITEYETSEGLLPAFVLPKGHALDVAADPQVGDLVAIYSRGRHRAARVTRRGPKRVTVAYTTEGARTDAERIAAINYEVRVRGEAARAREAAADYAQRADAIDAGTVDPEERNSGCHLYGLVGQDRAAAVAAWRQTYPTRLREWAADSAARGDEFGEIFLDRLAEARRQDSIVAKQRIIDATHVTSKSVPLAEVFAVEVVA